MMQRIESSNSLRRSFEASNLRDLLKIKDNEPDDGRDSLAGLSLAAVLGCEDIRKAPTRTLMDIIKDEESGAAYRSISIPHSRQKNWKSFKDVLRIRRAGIAWSTSSSNPVSDTEFPVNDSNIEISAPILTGPPSSSSSTRGISNGDVIHPLQENIPITIQQIVSEMNLNADQSVPNDSDGNSNTSIIPTSAPIMRLAAALEAERIAREGQQSERTTRDSQGNGVMLNAASRAEEMGNPVNEAAPMRMSLMALLEETDGPGGRFRMGTEADEEEEEEDEEEEEEQQQVEGEEGGGGGGVEHVCCVCMVRHKGAAFIPCGHTFCRLCSRELWVSRGNCPLCNNYILEILDIF